MVIPATVSDSASHFVDKLPDLFDLLASNMNIFGMTGDVLIQRVGHIRYDIGAILATGLSRKLKDPALTELALDACLLKLVTTEMSATSVRFVMIHRKIRL